MGGQKNVVGRSVTAASKWESTAVQEGAFPACKRRSSSSSGSSRHGKGKKKLGDKQVLKKDLGKAKGRRNTLL